MPLVKSGPDRQTPTAPFLLHRVTVARRRGLSPGFIRITFSGPTLDRFADPGLDQRIKLILPAPDGSLGGLPFEDDWYGAWRALPDERRPVIRTYTTRAVRPADHEVDIDLVVHEPCGPAGRFAAACTEGDRAVLLGPNVDAPEAGGGIDFRLPPSASRVLIAGDETALPAIARIVEALPRHIEGTVLVEAPHHADGAQLPAHPGVEVRVLARGTAPAGTLLEPAVRAAVDGTVDDAPSGDLDDVDVDAGILWEVPGDGAIPRGAGPSYAWLAGEAGVIAALRRMLVAELGFDRRSVAFMGYWRAGSTEGS